MKPKIKTQEDLWDDLTLIEKIDHILLEFNIKKRSKPPFTEWHETLAWECHVTIEEVENELKKSFEFQSETK